VRKASVSDDGPTETHIITAVVAVRCNINKIITQLIYAINNIKSLKKKKEQDIFNV